LYANEKNNLIALTCSLIDLVCIVDSIKEQFYKNETFNLIFKVIENKNSVNMDKISAIKSILILKNFFILK
jgi:hypothetical protein